MARRLGKGAIALIIIDVVLIGVFIALFATQPQGPADTPTVSDQSTTSAGPSATPDAGSTQAVTAPADALNVAEFASPSGNIWCTLTEESAICQINEVGFTPATVNDCTDNELVGRIVQVSADGALYPCPDGNIPGPAVADRTVLEYGTTTVVGDSMCASSESGIVCTNLSTGASFAIARAGISLN